MRRLCREILVLTIVTVGLAVPASAQLGQLLSPGQLSRAHAKLEGSANCEKCHEQRKQVSATRCLSCHQPVAERIAAKKGVHADVKDDCVACHVEHAGRDAELRPFDTKKFDHASVTGFALTGRHAIDCDRCHKTRSFLTLNPSCSSCHADPHKGRLGSDCAKCHSTLIGFKETAQRFDHSRARFPLEGAHRTVACAKCHINQQYSGLRFSSCADCHQSPHKSPVGHDCASCHVPASWHADRFDHARTGTPLIGKHLTVPCAKCHVRPATQVRLQTRPCAACHADPHRGAFKGDCAACHTETGFKGAPYDHSTHTRFPLVGKHRTLSCAACHGKAQASALAFKRLDMQCASCHKDPHKAQLGNGCEKCHTADSFRLTRYVHPRFPEFFAGQHAAVACEKCHRGAVQARTYKNLPTGCVTCHRDVHLGQLPQCTNCHSVDAPKFAPSRFQHDATAFPLTGRHKSVDCRSCHKQESGAFPAGAGSAVRFKGVAAQCSACHRDVHLGQLGTSCNGCHTTEAFSIKAYKHRMSAGFFRGKHATAQCADCHKRVEAVFPAGKGVAVRFTGTGTSCASCHKDAHRGQLGTTCERCHDVSDKWSTASRAFHKAGVFPLEGRHLTVACGDCHRNGVVKGTPTRCFDCHAIRRQDDRFHQNLGNECEQCHRPTSWTATSFDHGTATKFALNAPHKSLACDQCHLNGVFTSIPSDCVSCHLRDYERANEPNHQAAGFPLTCQVCHRPSDPTWQGVSFAHTSFALEGAHRTQRCGACHRNNVYKGTARDCAGCHRTDYEKTKNPNHAAATFAMTCDACHSFSDVRWTDGRFAHTTWQLIGRHSSAACADCHKSDVFRGLRSDCQSCHKTDYDRASTPNHSAAGFPLTCETCHKISDADWKGGRFDHLTFPLAGAHVTQACAACHKNNVYAGTSRVCAGCHQQDYNATKAPPHAAASFGTACETCHKFSDAQWSDARFAHASWPLIGQHATASCNSCHTTGVYRGLASQCSSCHKALYDKSTAPNHAAVGFPLTCDSCHKISDASWDQGQFAHTTFALSGAHAAAACAACHKNGVYRGTARICSGCHQAEYEATKSPAHASVGFPTTCETCHRFTDLNWNQGRFDHATFPLAGVHSTQACTACHQNGVYRGTSRTCSGCHQADYTASKAPSHTAAGFNTTCESCHKFTDARWSDGHFDHLVWPLIGQHTNRACPVCHATNVYRGLPSDCLSCHKTEYDQTRNPNHAATGFPTSCATCHKISDATWNQGVFAHTTFPLSGVHAAQACTACHQNGIYKGTPRACAGCHQAAYNASTAPNHTAAGFSTTCETCHNFSDAVWTLGRYSHLVWPLIGRHSNPSCPVCHATNVYRGLPSDCLSCHRVQYDRTTTPNHAAAGFPLTCETCHKISDSAWTQGVFAHTTFPLAGVHAAQTCTGCHAGGIYRGTPRTCVGCHLTQYNTAANPNHIAAGFPTTCETCHKYTDSTWQQGVFTHSSFPLAGVHATQPCTACHVNGIYLGTPRTCVGCHLADYNGAQNPNHIAAGFPTTCDTCHKYTDSNWQQGVFNHTWFPIVSGPHSGHPCAACHIEPTNFAVFSCTVCHDRGETDSHHRDVSGYRYDSLACYACHPQGRH